ncbi:MAG TPA: antibiotic biosynthesis monooxygenase, partial [Rhodobacterales bacterium]|nr:antibiotic biosynthesis monooxygenase [Rhodobacterales bacterium]
QGEPGCLSFEVTPDPAVEGRWQVAEVFVDQAAFDAHQARAAASDWAAVSAEIPRRYTIEEIET